MACIVLGGTGGGGGYEPPPPPPPPHCTVRGTELVTPTGFVSNEVLKATFDTGKDVYLVGRDGPERIVRAEWVPVEHFYWIEVDGHSGFGASESTTLKPEGGKHRWCSKLKSGVRVDTALGYRRLDLTRVDEAVDVLQIELEGPSHEYMAVEGVWTHNVDKIYPVD